KDFQTRLQWIVRFDKLQLGRSTAEQVCEQSLKLGIDDIEGGDQAFAALAVKALDGATQLADRIDNVIAFANQSRKLTGTLQLFFFRTQIDRPQTFTFHFEPVDLALNILDFRQGLVRLQSGNSQDLVRANTKSFMNARFAVMATLCRRNQPFFGPAALFTGLCKFGKCHCCDAVRFTLASFGLRQPVTGSTTG